MSIEAMKQALKVLEDFVDDPRAQKEIDEASIVLRQAIAEEETKPVKVSVNEFMMRVEGNEDLIGRPFIWTEWPTKK
jgi:hypothetical protein